MKKPMLPAPPPPIEVDFERWPALNPKSPGNCKGFLCASINVQEILDAIHDAMVAQSSSWEHLGPVGAAAGEANAGDLFQHLMLCGAMRFIINADRVMRFVMLALSEGGDKWLLAAQKECSAAIMPREADWKPGEADK